MSDQPPASHPGWPTGTATPEDFVKAHQYLYYVKSDPVWNDFQYDAYCKEFGLQGGGGSDRAADYPPHIARLAEGIWAYYHRTATTPAAPAAPPVKPRKVRGKKAAKPEPEGITFI